MKKLGFGLFGFILILSVVLYFIKQPQGSSSTTLQPLKHAVNLWLKEMQHHGFEMTDRVQSGEEDHFTLIIKTPQDVVQYLQQKGLRTEPEKIEPYKGFKVNTDIHYQPDTISIELHPLNVPEYFKTSIQEKNQLAKLEEMIQREVFATHIDIHYSAQTFDGNFKDINESFEDVAKMQIALQTVRFAGKFKNETIIEHNESAQTLHFNIDPLFNRNIQGFTNSYKRTGESLYDYTGKYSASEITTSEGLKGDLVAKNVQFSTISSVTNGLAIESVDGSIESIDLHSKHDQDSTGLRSFKFSMRTNNLAVNALKSNHTLSQEVHVDIPNLSVETMEFKGKILPGFTLHSTLNLEPSLDIHAAIAQPKESAEKMKGMIHLSIEKELLEYLKKDPETMLFYMMYRPKREDEQRIYDIHIDHGSLIVNDKPVEL